MVEQYIDRDQEAMLLLALSPYCSYCTLSMPFYRELLDTINTHSHSMQVVVAVDTSVSVALQKVLLEDEGILVDSIVALPFGAMKIHGVPSVIHVNPDGIVLDLWKGLLNEERQQDLLTSSGLSTTGHHPD